MRIIKVLGISMMAVFLLLGVSSIGMAQEEETTFAFGKVSKIQGNQITLMIFDFQAGGDVDVIFTTDDQTEIDGYDSIADIQVGDEVDLEYVDVDGKKVIRYLYKSTDDEEEEGQMDEPDMLNENTDMMKTDEM